MTENSTVDAGHGEGPENIRGDDTHRLGRRGLIMGAAAAGVGTVAGLAAVDPAGAANGGAVILGAANKATATTSITNKKANALEGAYTGSSVVAVGVLGESTTGYGVSGYTTGPNAGVGGTASGEGASGLFGTSSGTDGFGLFAEATGSGGIAVYADGNATVSGSLSKGGGSFRIDHPLDPGGKYLYHSFVESPDMMNVYNGTVVLGFDGRATVDLPDFFQALNRDYRYQLTAIGSAAPDLHVSDEVLDGTFSIAGGEAGQKVSWQVTGIRQDAWANANRIPVEVDKPIEDQGRYLHPELFGGRPVSELIRGRGECDDTDTELAQTA
jgi:hypothetical protein